MTDLPPRGLALLKLGGSLITDKAKESAFRPTRAARLLEEVAAAGRPVVLVHGAGSFGHPQVARHHGALAGTGPAADLAARTVLDSLVELRRRVLAAAAKAGLDAAPVAVLAPPGPGSREAKEAARLLGEGKVPVLHGALVRSGAGWRVLGGDELMALLARALPPEVAVWATDVAGVFDRDPGDPGATLLGEVRAGQLVLASGRGADVTGRMQGKLLWARQVAAACPTWIVGGHLPGRLRDALRGHPKGTRILP